MRDTGAQADCAVAAHALPVATKRGYPAVWLANPAGGSVDLRIQIPVVVAWNDVDRVNAALVEAGFTETRVIEHTAVGMESSITMQQGLACGRRSLYQQLRASEDFQGADRGD